MEKSELKMLEKIIERSEDQLSELKDLYYNHDLTDSEKEKLDDGIIQIEKRFVGMFWNFKLR